MKKAILFLLLVIGIMPYLQNGNLSLANKNFSFSKMSNVNRIALISLQETQITGLTAYNVGSTGFLVKWDTLSRPGVVYNVWVNGKLINQTVGNIQSISGLNPNKNYNVQIEAFLRGTRIGLSNVITQLTLGSTFVVSANNITSYGCSLNWNAVDGENVKYKIWVDGKVFDLTANTSENIFGLTSKQKHNIQIEVFENHARIDCSDVISITTL